MGYHQGSINMIIPVKNKKAFTGGEEPIICWDGNDLRWVLNDIKKYQSDLPDDVEVDEEMFESLVESVNDEINEFIFNHIRAHLKDYVKDRYCH